MKPYSAVVFDMDGVIVDSEPLHERAFLEIFDELGYGGSHGVHFPDYFGRSDRALWLDFIARHQPPQDLEWLLDIKQSRFLKLLRATEPIFQPVPALAGRLAAVAPLAVASGSMHVVIDAVLEMRGLRQHFQAVASVEDVGRPKPFPDVFLRAAQMLGAQPEQCVAIEDSAAGVKSAKAAGMRVIAITNSLPASKLGHADHVVADYEAVAALLL